VAAVERPLKRKAAMNRRTPKNAKEESGDESPRAKNPAYGAAVLIPNRSSSSS
jgi:hypothetical protein